MLYRLYHYIKWKSEVGITLTILFQISTALYNRCVSICMDVLLYGYCCFCNLSRVRPHFLGENLYRWSNLTPFRHGNSGTPQRSARFIYCWGFRCCLKVWPRSYIKLKFHIFNFQFIISCFEFDSTGFLGGFFERVHANEFARKDSNCCRERSGINSRRGRYSFYVCRRTYGRSISSKYLLSSWRGWSIT